MADDVRGGKGRRDEVGHSGIYPATGPYPEREAPVITPAEINKARSSSGPGVQQNDALKGAERSPRLGNEEDKPDNDALGG
jgi:hypothetical protein